MTEIVLIAGGLAFPESPIWSQEDACLYLVEWYGDRVLALRRGRLGILFQTGAGSGPSGLCQDPHGDFWVCLYSSRVVACYGPTGDLLQVISHYRGTPFRGPCDMVAEADGGIYFTDSGDFEDDWRLGRPMGAIYYLSPNGELSQIDHSLCFPNGIALAADGHTLYVNEHRRNRTLVYHLINKDHFLEKRVLYVMDSTSLLPEESAFELGPDGIGLDATGNLWIAHYGGGKLLHLSPNGELLDKLNLPRGRMPTNAAFSSLENSLYITEAEFGLLYRQDFDP